MKSLQEIYSKYSELSDKATTHSYIEHYEKLLAPYRNNSVIMELGLSVGGSLAMWQEYFVNSRIIGVDTNNNFPKEKFPGCEVIIADCTKPELIDLLGDTMFDLILHDAEHSISEQVASFNLLKHRMNKGGLFLIEDLQDVDATAHIFRGLHDNCEILDLRHERPRYDNVLVKFQF